MPRPRKPASPFRHFNSSPEAIRLVVLMYVRFPLSLRLWWNRFGPLFASDIRCQRGNRMRGFRHWCWHLDEMCVKLNGQMVYLWRLSIKRVRCWRATSSERVTRQWRLPS